MSTEVKKEDGSLNAYCVKCGCKLETTTAKLKELAKSGKFKTVDVLCDKCYSRFSVGLKLGEKEFGVG